MNEDEVRVRRFAIKYSPPTLVIEYQLGSSIFLKKIKIKTRKKATTDVDRIVVQLMKKYSDILDESKVNIEQIRDLIALLFSSADGDHNGNNLFVDADGFDDLNKASDEIVEQAKRKMDVKFEKNRLCPGDEGYVWDKQIDFQPEAPSEWDDDEEDDDG